MLRSNLLYTSSCKGPRGRFSEPLLLLLLLSSSSEEEVDGKSRSAAAGGGIVGKADSGSGCGGR